MVVGCGCIGCGLGWKGWGLGCKVCMEGSEQSFPGWGEESGRRTGPSLEQTADQQQPAMGKGEEIHSHFTGDKTTHKIYEKKFKTFCGILKRW